MSVPELIKLTQKEPNGEMEESALGPQLFLSGEVDEGKDMHKRSLSQKIPEDFITIGILGSGDYGKALATRCEAVGMSYFVGSRTPSRKKVAHFILDSLSYKEVIAKSDVIILAINAKHYETIAQEFKDDLAGKIVVDISNAASLKSACNALKLASLLPRSHIIKAFNTISAWAMSNDIYGASRSVYVCGDDTESRKTVMQFVQELGFTPIERGRLRAADALEKMPLRLFPAWRTATWIVLALWVFASGYYVVGNLTSYYTPKRFVRHLALYHMNRMVCWVALWLLSLVYLPGCIAGFLQLYRGTKYSTFPSWLDKWMKSRKQLGLYALGFAGMHACLSCIGLASDYIQFMQIKVKIPLTNQVVYHHLHWNAEVSLLCAVIAMTLFTVLGITSLPSVNQSMSWKEWDFVQSRMGYATLFFAFSHVVIYAYEVFSPHYIKFIKGLPPAVFLMPLLPGAVLMLKLFLMMPGVHGRLMRIREGWERRPAKAAAKLV